MSDEQNNNSGEGQNGSNNPGGNDGQNNSSNNSEGNNAQNNGESGNSGNTDQHGDAAQSQAAYEKRIAELDKRDKAMDDKLKRMETLNDKITAEGQASGGQPQETKEQTQKKDLVKNFGDCIPGLDKMI